VIGPSERDENVRRHDSTWAKKSRCSTNQNNSKSQQLMWFCVCGASVSRQSGLMRGMYVGRMTQYCSTPHFIICRKYMPSYEFQCVSDNANVIWAKSPTAGLALINDSGIIHLRTVSPLRFASRSACFDNPTLRKMAFCSSGKGERYVSKR
jgi:hypothetical protein